VYLFKNKLNNKIYVGETVQPNYRNRFVQHKRNSEKGVINYFYNAIRKYSWDSFEKYVLFQTEILSNTVENKKKLEEIVNEKEKYYINKFNSFDHKFGYNLTIGGDGVSGYTFSEESKKEMSENRSGEKHWNYGNFNNKTSEAIFQFDLDFNLIKEWPSMAEVHRELNYNSNNISRCCSNKLKTYKNCIWVKKSDYYDGYLQKYKSNCKHSKSERPVIQFDFKGNMIKEYNSAKDASIGFGNSSAIGKAASGKNPQGFGYIWIYKDLFTNDLLKEKVEIVKSC